MLCWLLIQGITESNCVANQQRELTLAIKNPGSSSQYSSKMTGRFATLIPDQAIYLWIIGSVGAIVFCNKCSVNCMFEIDDYHLGVRSREAAIRPPRLDQPKLARLSSGPIVRELSNLYHQQSKDSYKWMRRTHDARRGEHLVG
jgi:hypothetical protein